MKKFSLVISVLFFCLASTSAQAQGNTTPGVVLRVVSYKVMAGKMNDVQMDMRQHLKPVYDEAKKQGIIVDYRIYTNSTIESPNDWDITLVIAYKNWAALDVSTEKLAAITSQHYGSTEKQQEAANKRNQMRTLVSSRLIREQTLNPLP